MTGLGCATERRQTALVLGIEQALRFRVALVGASSEEFQDGQVVLDGGNVKHRKSVSVRGVDASLTFDDQVVNRFQAPGQDGPVKDRLAGPVHVVDVDVGLLHEVTQAIEVGRTGSVVGGGGAVLGPRDLFDHVVLDEVDEHLDLALPGRHVHGCNAVLVGDQLAQGLQGVDQAADVTRPRGFELRVPRLGARRAETFASRSQHSTQ